MAQIKCSKRISAPRTKVFDFLTDPKNVPELLEKDIEVEIENLAPEVGTDSVYSYMMTRFGFSQPVKLCINEIHRDSLLSYRQIQGLFQKWSHVQKFEDVEEGGTLVTDIVEYQMPMGLIGHFLSDLFVRQDMKRILENRLEQAASHFS